MAGGGPVRCYPLRRDVRPTSRTYDVVGSAWHRDDGEGPVEPLATGDAGRETAARQLRPRFGAAEGRLQAAEAAGERRIQRCLMESRELKAMLQDERRRGRISRHEESITRQADELRRQALELETARLREALFVAEAQLEKAREESVASIQAA